MTTYTHILEQSMVPYKDHAETTRCIGTAGHSICNASWWRAAKMHMVWTNLDDVPVSPDSFGSLLLPSPAVHCQHRAPCSLQHARICQSLLLVWENPDLAGHRHLETLQVHGVSVAYTT